MIAMQTRSLARTPIDYMTPDQQAWERQHRQDCKQYRAIESILIRAMPPTTADQAMELLRSIRPQPSIRARERLLRNLDGGHMVQVMVARGYDYAKLERLAPILGFTIRRVSQSSRPRRVAAVLPAVPGMF